jgi:hypothetical protein
MAAAHAPAQAAPVLKLFSGAVTCYRIEFLTIRAIRRKNFGFVITSFIV